MDISLHWTDFVALIGYFVVVIGIGVWVQQLFIRFSSEFKTIFS